MLFVRVLALSVSHSFDRFPFLSLARHLFLSLSPAVTFLPGAGRICPGRGKSFLKGGTLGKTGNFAVLPRPLTLGEVARRKP